MVVTRSARKAALAPAPASSSSSSSYSYSLTTQRIDSQSHDHGFPSPSPTGQNQDNNQGKRTDADIVPMSTVSKVLVREMARLGIATPHRNADGTTTQKTAVSKVLVEHAKTQREVEKKRLDFDAVETSMPIEMVSNPVQVGMVKEKDTADGNAELIANVEVDTDTMPISAALLDLSPVNPPMPNSMEMTFSGLPNAMQSVPGEVEDLLNGQEQSTPVSSSSGLFDTLGGDDMVPISATHSGYILGARTSPTQNMQQHDMPFDSQFMNASPSIFRGLNSTVHANTTSARNTNILDVLGPGFCKATIPSSHQAPPPASASVSESASASASECESISLLPVLHDPTGTPEAAPLKAQYSIIGREAASEWQGTHFIFDVLGQSKVKVVPCNKKEKEQLVKDDIQELEEWCARQLTGAEQDQPQLVGNSVCAPQTLSFDDPESDDMNTAAAPRENEDIAKPEQQPTPIRKPLGSEWRGQRIVYEDEDEDEDEDDDNDNEELLDNVPSEVSDYLSQVALYNNNNVCRQNGDDESSDEENQTDSRVNHLQNGMKQMNINTDKETENPVMRATSKRTISAFSKSSTKTMGPAKKPATRSVRQYAWL